MRPIVTVPNQVLTTPAKPVTNFDKWLTRLIADMSEALIATSDPKGVGLAAPQIGEPYRVFITKPTDRAKIRAFINPEIVYLADGEAEHGDNKKLEGCLSIPKIWGKVHRAKKVTLKFQDEKGAEHQEVFTGLMATIVQHETDHLNGILFSNRIIEQKEKFYTINQDKEGKDVLEEVKI